MDATDDEEVRRSIAKRKSQTNIFHEYYMENDFFASVEGILKIISAISCVVCAAVFVVGGRCARAGGLGAALAAALVLALFVAAAALRLPLYAPQAWLYADIIVSTVVGVVLLLTSVLSMTLCELSSAGVLDYLRGLIPIVSACLVIASAVITYVAMMRRWDAVRGPIMEPQRPPPPELEV